MHEGTIVALRLGQRFGFIFEQTGTPDIFFHMNDLADGLTFDERLKERRVRLDVVESGRGPRAANIQAATD